MMAPAVSGPLKLKQTPKFDPIFTEFPRALGGGLSALNPRFLQFPHRHNHHD
jgi:hypothetical protein